MSREDITVIYAEGGANLRAHVRLARNDAKVVEEDLAIDVDSTDIEYVELTEEELTSEKFTELLDDNARAADSLSLWCYRPVWLKFLKLLELHQPLPETVTWPLKEVDHGG